MRTRQAYLSRGIAGALIGVMMVVSASADLAPINLEFRPAAQSVSINQPVALGLWAYTEIGETQLFRALDMVFTWESEFLRLEALNQAGAAPLLSSGFPYADPYGLNETVPPQDGDGYYKAWAHLGQPILVTSDGVLLTTFVFRALMQTSATRVTIAPFGGEPPLETTVWGGPEANTIVTGALGFATVEVIPEPLTGALLVLGGLLTIRPRA